MTDPQTTPVPAADAPVEPAAEDAAALARVAADPTDPPADDATEQRPSREAAAYRLRLREVEADRDTIRGRLEVYERAHVERIAAERMTTPADLWLIAPDLDQLRGEDGAVDDEIVRGAVETVLADRPTWAKPPQPRAPAPNRAQGHGGNPPPPRGADAFRMLVENVT